MESIAAYATEKDKQVLTDKERDTLNTYNFLLLAYLDSAGYAERSGRKSPPLCANVSETLPPQ
jgi:hypothetical protein